MCFFTFCKIFFGKRLLAAIYSIIASTVFMIVILKDLYPYVSDCSDLIVYGTHKLYGYFKIYKCSQMIILDNVLFTLSPSSDINEAYLTYIFWMFICIAWTLTGLILLVSKILFSTVIPQAIIAIVWMLVSTINIVVNFLFLTAMIGRYYRYDLKHNFTYFHYWNIQHFNSSPLKLQYEAEHNNSMVDITGRKMSEVFFINTINVVTLIFVVLVAIETFNILLHYVESKKR